MGVVHVFEEKKERVEFGDFLYPFLCLCACVLVYVKSNVCIGDPTETPGFQMRTIFTGGQFLQSIPPSHPSEP